MPTCTSCGSEGSGSYCSNCGAAFATGAKKGGMSGCTIAMIVVGAIGCVTLPILAIIAAIAIPNLLNAVDRGKQKRTMSDMRTVATAVESYAVDHERYPATDGWTDAAGLVPHLQPTYVRNLPVADGWTNPIQYRSSGTEYEIWSTGKDGMPDHPTPEGPTIQFVNDILWRNGQFVAWPEGLQR